MYFEEKPYRTRHNGRLNGFPPVLEYLLAVSHFFSVNTMAYASSPIQMVLKLVSDLEQ
jgi:hypothetical protein